MGRQWRIEFEGALYHILSRGNECRDIFYNNEDRHLFLDTDAEISERFDLNIIAYVLMGNHLLVVDDGNRNVIPKSMKLVAGRTGQE